MVTILSYYGAFVGVLSAVSMALHVFGLDETKVGKVICTLSTDLTGVYKGLAGAQNK